jgi:hypothetical protein
VRNEDEDGMMYEDVEDVQDRLDFNSVVNVCIMGVYF